CINLVFAERAQGRDTRPSPRQYSSHFSNQEFSLPASTRSHRNEPWGLPLLRTEQRPQGGLGAWGPPLVLLRQRSRQSRDKGALAHQDGAFGLDSHRGW